MRLIASWCRKPLIAPGRLSHNINIPHPKEQGADKGSGRRALRKERDRIRPRRGRKTDRGDATFTAVCGGSAINVLAIAEAGAFLAAAAFGASLANVVLLSVLTVYSVASGNEQKLMTYVSLLSTALLGLCVTYGAYGEVTVSGDKGSKTISTEDVSKGNGVGNPVKIEGRGSTGRTISNTLNEQMAMHQVQSNPLDSVKWDMKN